MAALEDLRRDLAAEAERWLRPHITRLQAGQYVPRPKVVNDAVWGTTHLHKWEVAVLDSYIMQRLRYLRQLGVAHWVFPGAGHSRFEHSLGVLHQMQALLDGAERNSGRAGERLVSDVDVKLLRMAALLHDCGHTVMSHVSEPIVEALPGVRELRRRAQSVWHTRKLPSASEAIAAEFVTSDAFNEMLSLRQVGADFVASPGEATQRIAAHLLGGFVEPEKAFLSFFLNGAFDADKLDYMPRDCQMAGVPCAVDVGRVVEKVQCYAVDADQLPEGYRDWVEAEPGQLVRILALSRAGSRALEELAMTRALLFDKVYFHQKVRALEAMVRRLLAGQPRPLVEWLGLSDDEVVRADDPLARLLRDRVHLKRALFCPMPVEDDGNGGMSQESRETWQRFRDHARSGEFAANVKAEAKRVADLLGVDASSLDALPPDVDHPDAKKIGLDQYAFVGDSVHDFQVADSGLAGQRFEAAKRLSRGGYQVFSPEALVLPVFIAARTLLMRDYGRTFEPSSYAATKLDPEDVARAEATLREAGYFGTGGSPEPPLVPAGRLRSHRAMALESFLKTSFPRIEALAVRFGPYQSLGSTPVSPQAVATFLRQFETESRARAALRLLESVRFYERSFFAKALEATMRAALALGPVDVVCPLGGTGDSSAFAAYMMNDLPEELRRPVKPLELALDVKDRTGAIVLWDDFCGAGGHTITVLKQWAGAKKTPLEERHAYPLSRARLKRFKQGPTVVGFALARESGLTALAAYLVEAGMNGSTALAVDADRRVADVDTNLSSTDVFGDAQERDDLRQFLAEVGRRLLAPKVARTERPWSEADLADRVLGYGNTAQLVVFNYNVPTVTITALWEKGDGWIPLFQRRSKPAVR